MNNKPKLIGWFAIAIAVIGILSAIRDVGAMLFVGFNDTLPILRVYSVTLIILPFIFALILFAFGLAALHAKPYTRTLAMTFAYGQFLIAALKAIGAFAWLVNDGLIIKVIISVVSAISLPLLYAIVLAIYYNRKISESQQWGPGYPPQGVGSPGP